MAKLVVVSSATSNWGAEKSLLTLAKTISAEEIFDQVVLICRNKELSDAWESLNGEWKTKWNKGGLVSLFSLIEETREGQTVVVYFSLRSCWMIPFLRMRKFQVKQFIDLHDFLPTLMGKIKLNLLHLFSTGTIAVSRFSASQIWIRRGSVQMLFRPIENFEAFSPTSRYLKRSSKRIGVIGRLDPDKNIELAIDAFSAEGCDYVLVLKGSQFMSDSTNAILQEARCKLGQRLEIEHNQFGSQLYSDIDVLLVTNDKEPMGRTVLEAQMSKVPVVVPNSGGSSELVEESVSGSIYVARDEASLLSAVARSLVFDEHQLLKIRESVIERHNPTIYMRKYLEFLGI